MGVLIIDGDIERGVDCTDCDQVHPVAGHQQPGRGDLRRFNFSSAMCHVTTRPPRPMARLGLHDVNAKRCRPNVPRDCYYRLPAVAGVGGCRACTTTTTAHGQRPAQQLRLFSFSLSCFLPSTIIGIILPSVTLDHWVSSTCFPRCSHLHLSARSTAYITHTSSASCCVGNHGIQQLQLRQWMVSPPAHPNGRSLVE